MKKEFKLKMYRDMLRIRHFEERVRALDMKGRLPGFFHLYVGEEAVAVGACSALKTDDYITSTHRGHGHVIAKGAELKYAIAELYGKAAGYNKGKGGSLHLAVPALGVLGANGIVGAGIPIATGAAFSAKYRDSGQVALSFFGDGASNQGTFHEAINIASAYKLPAVYVCENNLYGVTTYQPSVRNIEDIAVRASAYGIPGKIVDGNDIESVYNEVVKAVKRARDGDGPTLIECKTYRHYTHFIGEPDTYRPKEEVREWKNKDPILRYKAKLVQDGIAAEADLDKIEAEVVAEMDAAVEFAENAPEPALETATADVYAD